MKFLICVFMSKLGYFVSLILLTVSAISCKDEKLVGETIGNIRVTGIFESVSRTSYETGDKAVSVSWVKNDRIGVFSGRCPDVFEYKAVSDGKQTDFIPEGEGIEAGEGEEVCAYYPFQPEALANNEYPEIPLPYLLVQNYNNGAIDPEADVMYAEGKVNNNELMLHFSHLFSFIKLDIKSTILNDAVRLVLDSYEPLMYFELLSEDALYNIKDKTFKGVKLYNYVIYYLPESGNYNNEITTCYIAVLPTSGNNVVTINVDYANDERKLLLEKKAPEGGFKAGHIYSLSVDNFVEDEFYEMERNALIAFYNSTDGDKWYNNTNWCSDVHLSEWEGVEYSNGHVRSIMMLNNNVGGTLPDELKDLTSLETLYLHNNNVAGEIPSGIGEIPELRYLVLSDNNLTGNLPASLAGLDNLVSINLNGNRLSGKIPDAIVSCDWWQKLGYDGIIQQQPGYQLTFPLYESTDYSMDKTYVQLQNADSGNGINVVFMGDGFSDRQIESGLYDKLMKQGMEAFFLLEPYSSFRNLFNVYYVNAVSKNEGITGFGETVFSCALGEGTHIDGDDSKCMKYASVCDNFTEEEMNEILIVVLANSIERHGTCYLSGSNKYLGDYGRGSAVAYSTLSSYEEIRTGTMIHECGHGFAKLSDEYVIYENQTPDDLRYNDWGNRDKWGWRKNVDFVSDPAKVYWSKFIDDPRYKDEQIGVYEGGRLYRYGAYRPTDESIMRTSQPDKYGFNAPSREAIYYRIHKLAYGESWIFDFEKFVDWDMAKSRWGSRMIIDNCEDEIFVTPPVMYNRRWENGRFIYE